MRSTGDLDKLCRAVLDSLQPTVLTDDSLVVSLTAKKRYETPEFPPGVDIIVEELT
jgi:Holliday junction resolvase RusA-like endonuclease